MSKKILMILFFIEVAFIVIGLYTIFRLWRFKQCNDNNFQLPYCEKYKEY